MPIRRHHIVLPLLAAGALVFIGAATGAVVLFSGVATTSATRQHFKLTHKLLEIGLHHSIRTHARHLQAPALDDPHMRDVGLACYRDHCTQCHGAPGIAPQNAALGMLPVPASLVQTAREWPAEWLFYVTSKGVRMTGMPAWEYRLSEHSLWSTVAFLKALPEMDPGQYGQLLAHTAAECEPRSDLPAKPLRELGDILLRQYACHACHVIDGVVGPDSATGPPLRNWTRRGYIAGILPNTEANLARWIRDPQLVSPQTQMPHLGVAPLHADVMARFLFMQR